MKKAIVIGASSGIGKELALRLARAGYAVGLMARRVPLLESLQKEIPTQTYVGSIDLSKPEEAVKQAQSMIDRMGGMDLMVISSGTGSINYDLHWEKEKQTILVNVEGFCALAGLAFNTFKKEGHGHLVGISSIAALRGSNHAPAYHASKAFMSNYLEGLRKKAFQEKLAIDVTDVRPGYVDTPMALGDHKFWVAPPQKAAEQIYNAIQKKKEVVYITKRWSLIAYVMKVVPFWIYKRVN